MAHCIDCRSDERGTKIVHVNGTPCLGCKKFVDEEPIYSGTLGPFCCIPCRDRTNNEIKLSNEIIDEVIQEEKANKTSPAQERFLAAIDSDGFSSPPWGSRNSGREASAWHRTAKSLVKMDMIDLHREGNGYRAIRKIKLTVTICLYGNSASGFYCLASVNNATQKLGAMYGKCPELGGITYESPTQAIWTIQHEMVGAVPSNTPVAIHMDLNSNPVVALAKMNYIPTFGSLKWSDGSESNHA